MKRTVADHSFATHALILIFVALLVPVGPSVADTAVMPTRRFTAQELVRWNAGARVVAPEQWAEIDAALDEHRATVAREAKATTISEAPLGPGQPRRVVRIDSMRDLERIARQLVARLEAQRARERGFIERLRSIVGEHVGQDVERLVTAHAIGAAKASNVAGYSVPALKMPDVEALVREVTVTPEAAEAARHALFAALPRLRPLAERLTTATVRWRATDPIPGAASNVPQELRRAHVNAEQSALFETRRELAQELARTRRAIVQSLPGDVQDAATMVLYDQAASEHGVMRAVPAVRNALRRMKGLDLKTRRDAILVVDQGLAEFAKSRMQFVERAEKSLRETGEIEAEAMESLEERLEGVISRGQVQLGLALGIAPMARFMRFLESDGDELHGALEELIGEDQVDAFLSEMNPSLVERWSGRPSYDQAFYQVGWSNLAEVRPLNSVDVGGIVPEARVAEIDAIIVGQAAEWQRRIAPLQQQIAGHAAVVEFGDGGPPQFEAMAASHLADLRRLEEMIMELDAAVFVALADTEVGDQGIDATQLDELRVQRTIARHSGRTSMSMWWAGHGSSMPNVVDPLLIVERAELDPADRAIARLVVAEHATAIVDALRVRHDVHSQRASLMSAQGSLRGSIWQRIRQAPEESEELQPLQAGLGGQMRTAIAALGAAALDAERGWQKALDALREDWAAAVDPDSAARLESFYRREAYPQLAFDGPKRSEAIMLAADSAETAEDRAAVLAVAARLDAETEALIAGSVAAIEAVPLTQDDYHEDRWHSVARWGVVQEHVLQRSELESRAIRDAVMILGEEKLARLPRLRGPYERDPYE